MKQSGKSINPANADEVLTSSKDAIAKGQQQFFTPENFAAAILTPISKGQTSIYDPQCGDSSLLSAASRILAPAYGAHLIGTDIDSRSKAPTDDAKWSIHPATDLTALTPLLADTGASFGNILANPPFSLRWSVEPIMQALFAVQDRIHYPAITEWLCNHHIDSDKCIDSTLWTMLFTLAFMHHHDGESLVICNDSSATRYLADPHGMPTPLARYCFLRLTVDAPVFPDIHHAFATSVIYLSTSHGLYNSSSNPPLHLTCQTNKHDEISDLLCRFNKRSHHKGNYFSQYNVAHYQHHRFTAAVAELKATAKDKAKHNITLDTKGRISVYLSTFATLKFSNSDHDALRRLHTLRGQHPASLVVQAPSRRALQYAVTSGIWTVHPAVHAAVEKAITSYNAVRAPFYRLSDVQSLGYLDEEESILCTTTLFPHFIKGKSYPINCYTEKIQSDGEKFNLKGETEKITLHSQELVVRITGEDTATCTFHVNKADGDTDKYTIADLVQHFHVPAPPDIATTNPDLHAALTAKLAIIQDHINSAA